MHEWKYMVDNEYTFYGVYCEFYDKVSRNWKAASTRSQNELTYTNKIIPNMDGHDTKPISSYLREDYDAVIERIIKRGQGNNSEPYQPYAESTIRTFRRLIYYVVAVASEEGLCENVLWESCYNPKVSTEDEERIAKNALLPKSLTITQEIAVARSLLTDPMQTGQKMGLLLMYALGLRNAEACAVDYDDIKPMQSHPECTVIWIYKTTGYDSSTRKLGGKSKNADRIIPVPGSVVEIINTRRKKLEELLSTDIGKFPIVCPDDQWDQRCSARQLTAAARKLFQSINMNAAQVSIIDDDLHSNRDSAFSIEEQEPTAYLFRRNFGTHMHILGLTEAEIQYVIGHDIEDPYETRNEFVNEEKLYQIYLKMVQRPLLNNVKEELSPVPINVGCTSQLNNTSSLRLPANKCKTKLHLQAHEPLDSIRIRVSTHPRRLAIECEKDMFTSETTQVGRSIDVRKQYQKVYR